MKKILVGIISLVIATAASADIVKRFAPTNWSSTGTNDIKTIKLNVQNSSYDVQIYVSPVFNPMDPSDKGTGINVKNCGDKIVHLNIYDSVVCKLSPENPVITFSADKEALANGTYQIGS